MIESDYVASLAEPQYALLVAAIVVIGMTTVFYLSLSKARHSGNRIPSRKYSILAEFCGILGLIGLLTFAGRAKLDSNEYSKSVDAAKSLSEMHVSLYKALKNLCQPVDYKASSPTLPNGYLVDMCVFVEEYDSKRDTRRFWPDLRRAVQKLAAVNSIDAAKAAELLNFDKSLSKFLQTRHEAEVEPIRRIRINNEAPWLFLLFCFSAAMVGVSIKLARVIVEYKHPWEKQT